MKGWLRGRLREKVDGMLPAKERPTDLDQKMAAGERQALCTGGLALEQHVQHLRERGGHRIRSGGGRHRRVLKRGEEAQNSFFSNLPKIAFAPAYIACVEGQAATYYMPRYIREEVLARSPKQALSMLHEKGVEVVPNLLPLEVVKRTMSALMQTLEGMFPGFKYSDRSTWRLLRDYGALHAMLLQHYGIGWSQGVVDVRQVRASVFIILGGGTLSDGRQDPRLVEFWAALWSEVERKEGAVLQRVYRPEDMLCSADGVAVYLNTVEERGGFRKDKWYHWDRAPSDGTFSVQGFVNLVSTKVDGAALQLLLGSHRHQEAYVAAQEPRPKDPVKHSRFYSLYNVSFYEEGKGCEEVCIQAKKGDLVLWDSRTIHFARTTAKHCARLRRAVVYVSMQPKRLASKRDLKAKQRAFKEKRCTTHNAASGVKLFPKLPRVYSMLDRLHREQVVPVSEDPVLTPLGRSLFGI